MRAALPTRSASEKIIAGQLRECNVFFLNMTYESEHSNNKQTVLKELHRRIDCTQENTVKKTKQVDVQSNICVININSLVLPCLRGSQSSKNSLKRHQQFIESVDQMMKICEHFQ